jgi:hypothetical protein
MIDDLGRSLSVARIVQALKGAEPFRELCRACVDLLPVAGASLVVVRDGLPWTLASSDGAAARLEELQLTLGEGPSLDAQTTGRVVREPDLTQPAHGRWAAFGPAAREAGARSLFSFPLRIGAVHLGALTTHAATAGDLSADRYRDAKTIADMAVAAILVTQSGAEPGLLGPELATFATYSASLHQASGMVSVQLGIGVAEAMVRIRAHAFSSGLSLEDVAGAIVGRRLRLGD